MSENDNVNHPKHYTETLNGIEVIDAIEASMQNKDEWVGFLKGQVIKYLARLGQKDDKLQDAKKAQWYMNRLVTFLEKHDGETYIYGDDKPADRIRTHTETNL